MGDDRNDEALLINAIYGLPDGRVKRILDLCYNHLTGITIQDTIETLYEVPDQTLARLEDFMTEDGHASFKQRFGFICRYFRQLTAKEIADWVDVLCNHVNDVAELSGCSPEDVIRSINPMLGCRISASRFMTGAEQERAVLAFLTISQSLNGASYSNMGLRHLDDPLVLQLVTENPEDVQRIHDLCVEHGEKRGFAVKEAFEGTTPVPLAGGLL